MRDAEKKEGLIIIIPLGEKSEKKKKREKKKKIKGF